MPAEPPDTPTMRLLREAAAGNRQAADDLFPLLYGELRNLAAACMAQSPAGHTLQPTALVHEAYARLVSSHDPQWEGRRHFFFAAARAMRDILGDHARRKMAQKRGGGLRRVDAEVLEFALDTRPEEILALGEALDKLGETNARLHQVVTLRYYAGLTNQETAELLQVDSSTVARDWRAARAWLYGQINGDRPSNQPVSP